MQSWTKEDFRLLYDDYADMVYRICFLYLKNESDAKDGVQEVFLKIWEKQPVYENREHEKAWLIQTTKHYCFDVLKSSWRQKRSDTPEWKQQQTAVEVRSESEETLLEYVMKLPAKFREVIYLYYYEEYSIREMSGILGRKESTIQSRLSAARKKLKKILEKEGSRFSYERGKTEREKSERNFWNSNII